MWSEWRTYPLNLRTDDCLQIYVSSTVVNTALSRDGVEYVSCYMMKGHPMPASFPLSAPVELVVAKAEEGLAWGRSSSVLTHQWYGLKETENKKKKRSSFSSAYSTTPAGKDQHLWLSDLHHDVHGLRLRRALFPLTSWVGEQESVYWLAATEVRPPKSTVLAAKSTLVRKQQSTKSTARPGVSNSQGPALTAAEDWPLMHWSQVCDRSQISSTQCLLFSCIEWLKMKFTVAIRCCSPKLHSH